MSRARALRMNRSLVFQIIWSRLFRILRRGSSLSLRERSCGENYAATSFAQAKTAAAGEDPKQTRPNNLEHERAIHSERTSAAHADGPRAYLSTGVGWAICAALGFGVLFWFLGFHVVPAVGSAVSVWVMRLTALVALAVAAAPTGQTLHPPRGSVWWLLLAEASWTPCFVANNAASAPARSP